MLNNHLRFKIKYHPVDTDGVMTEGNPDGNYIVGFEVSWWASQVSPIGMYQRQVRGALQL